MIRNKTRDILLFITTVAVQGLPAQTPTSTQNYTMHRILLDEAGTVGVTEVQYYDGLGRPTVAVSNANGNGTNFTYQLQEYDAKGRASKSWLPVAGSSSPDYMDVSSLQSAAMGRDDVPYSETVYDALDRPVESWGAGEAWRNAGRRVQTIRRANAANEVRRYTVNAAGHLTSSGFHPAGTLSVEEIVDEDNRTLKVYKNVAGLTLLERRSTDNNTYFVYNYLDQLQYVLSPMASAALANGTWSIANNQTLRNYAYYYEYDYRGRCVKKKLPGCVAVLYQYDKADRLVFSRDGNQQQNGTGTFYLYDNLGRETVRGICQSANFPNTANLLARAVLQSGGTYAGYNITLSLPPLVQLLVVNYYDTYSQMPDSASLPFVSQSEYAATKGDAHGLLTGKRVYQLGQSAAFYPTVYFYDGKGQTVLSRTMNFRHGIDDTFTKYTFTGKPLNMHIIHRNASQTVMHSEDYEYTYDGVDRPLTVTHSADANPAVTIAEYTYDNLGMVSRKQTAGTDIHYTYNLRNWVTSVDAGFSTFKEQLYYQDVPSGGVPQWGGNISASKNYLDWDLWMQYDYQYDGLSRMTSANSMTNYSTAGLYDEEYSYDANGNVEWLIRKGMCEDGSYDYIDDLELDYRGNQLSAVIDGSQDPATEGLFHFVDGVEEDVEYLYDNNGNMTQDINRDITGIDYNVLNLPETIDFGDNSHIRNIYTADGVKRKNSAQISNSWLAPIGSASSGSTIYSSEYCGNLIYKLQLGKKTRQYLHFDGGYITFDESTPKYHFYIQDHLGNNRAVVSQTGQVEQKAQYYPSGAIMTSISEGLSQQPYLYSGKELDRMHGLDWYDFGARHYDAALLRWHSIDPLCEKYYHISPYAFCANNFVNAFDPNGDSVAVLIEPKGALGAGHMAILIQNENNKWNLYSKNGTEKHKSSGESFGDDKAAGNYPGVQDFLESDKNIENGTIKYTEAYVIPTDKNKEAKEGAMSELDKGYYNLLGSNCAETVQKALEEAGLDAGRLPKYVPKTLKIVMSPKVGSVAGMILEETPKLIYYRIKNNNQGEVVKVNNKDEK